MPYRGETLRKRQVTAGMSADDLTERALKQAKHFGVEMLFKRNVEEVQ
jgi:hypothetical protein